MNYNPKNKTIQLRHNDSHNLKNHNHAHIKVDSIKRLPRKTIKPFLDQRSHTKPNIFPENSATQKKTSIRFKGHGILQHFMFDELSLHFYFMKRVKKGKM